MDKFILPFYFISVEFETGRNRYGNIFCKFLAYIKYVLTQNHPHPFLQAEYKSS